ncbi:DUF4394 domain-containing protein [Egbenema bharatensis]|uniref:DUF4394 domain-containing protein n=1 Tax=Egbenema bharatensis TaxID=3463334 RepID=UPI003A85E45B
MTKNPGNKFSSALKVNLKNGRFSYKGLLNESNEGHLYRFKTQNRCNFDLSLGRVNGNAELTLINRKGKIIARSDEKDGKPEFIRQRLNAGVYFLRVGRISGEFRYHFKSRVVELAGKNFRQALQVKTTKTTSSTGVSTKPLSYFGSISKENNTAFYQFNLSDRSTFLGLLEGLSANTEIELYDSKRTLITVASGSQKSSGLLNQVLEAGSYFIKIKVKGGSTNYKLKLGFNSIARGLFNISDPTRLIGLGSSAAFSDQFFGAIGSRVLDDVYKVNLDTPSSLNLVLDGLQADANLQLLSSDGTVLVNSTNPGTEKDLISQNLKAGTYYIRVLPGEGGLPTRYNLNVSLGALKLFGLSDNNTLLAFNPDQPNAAVDIAVSGLAANETLQSIDFRPATGDLYGLSSANQLYTIDLKTGAAKSVGSALNPALTGTALGLDFNPTVDRLRVVSDAKENLRLVPTTGSLAGTDTVLSYASGDANAGATPAITAVAYTNNFAGTPTTTLYGIDTTLGTLVRIGDLNGSPTSPNSGQLFTVGSLGATFAPGTGFDIFTDRSLTNTAYALSGSTLYSINLTTGSATSVGMVSLAVPPATSSPLTSSPSSSPSSSASPTPTVTATTEAIGSPSADSTSTAPTPLTLIGLTARV